MSEFDSSRPRVPQSKEDIRFEKEMMWESKKRDFKHHFRKLNREEQKEIILMLTEIFLELDSDGDSEDNDQK